MSTSMTGSMAVTLGLLTAFFALIVCILVNGNARF